MNARQRRKYRRHNAPGAVYVEYYGTRVAFWGHFRSEIERDMMDMFCTAHARGGAVVVYGSTPPVPVSRFTLAQEGT